MRILVSGSSGFLGAFLIDELRKHGHTISPLVRPGTTTSHPLSPGEHIVRWAPLAGVFEPAAAEDHDALVHLAGASIAGGRWNRSRKALLRRSRIDSTRHLMGALSKLQRPPRVIVSASAIGYYGNRKDEILTESSAPGNDFLAKLCLEWEAEAVRGTEFGARVVIPRFGIILAAGGGALPEMAKPIKLGVGGRLGSGKQWMSWLTLKEAASIIEFALGNSNLSGPVNAVTPTPVQNTEFTRVLAKTLQKQAPFPAPGFALRLILGEMANGLLLSSQRVSPSKLEQSEYTFQEVDLTNALAHIYRS